MFNSSLNNSISLGEIFPDYSSGINIPVPTPSSNAFIASYDCFMQGISYKSNYRSFYVNINGIDFMLGRGNITNQYQSNNIYLFLPKGTKIIFSEDYVEASSLFVFPLKGAK